MTPQASNSGSVPARIIAVGEWLLVMGLIAALSWTTLCLGGYLATTMVVTSWSILSLGALGGLLWALGQSGGMRSYNLAVLLPVPFLLYALASVIWLAPAQWLAWGEWLLWFQMWLIFALMLHFGRSRRQTSALVTTILLLGLTGVVMATYQRFVDPSFLMLGRTQAAQFTGRSSGMFGIPNSLAGLLELMIPVCLTLLFSRKSRFGLKVLCGWLAALYIFALVLSGSRGGWIGLGLALLLWPLISLGDWRKKLLGCGAILLSSILGFWTLYHFSEFARSRIAPFLSGDFEASRPLIWKAGWRIWLDHPWWGSGAASYNVLFDQYRPSGFLNEPDWAHNDYLNTLSDYGLVGFILWIGAGASLLWLGWLAIRRARLDSQTAKGVRHSPEWRLGLFLGLLAFSFHLGVDFHTKLPALAFAAAIVVALLIREEPFLIRPIQAFPAWSAGIGLGVICLSLAGGLSSKLYPAEALRYDARRSIDHYAMHGEGNLLEIIAMAKPRLIRAVRMDPTNGQAWSDLAYMTVQSWRTKGSDLVSLGRFAELAADEALKCCSINAEFWIRKGVAIDLQRGRPREAETCFQTALELAPNSPGSWYYFAYHLQELPQRRGEAIQAIDACLALDRYYLGAETLKGKLVNHH